MVRFDQPAKESGEEALDQAPMETVEVLMDLDEEQQGSQPNLKVARAGQKKMVRFDQSTKGSGLGITTGQDVA